LENININKMNSKMNFKKGFTLIELLVVVAIIALLTAVVLASLSTARGKSGDAAVKTNLGTIRSQAELFFANNSNSFLPSGGSTHAISACPAYSASGTNMLSKDKNIADAITEAKNRGSGVSSCYNSSTAWAVAVGLKTNSNNSWCIDSSGQSRQTTSMPGSSINATTFVCN
jgi:prepilin-type N-terminal cleavage/methylation domain-containing protein